MAIPVLREDGWLPEGHWTANWDEVVSVFGGMEGSRRAELFTQLQKWNDSVRAIGCSGTLILNGSFASSKTEPDDIDALFVFNEPTEILLKRDADARDLLNHSLVKQRGFGDLFCFAESTVRAFPAWCRLDMFDVDKETGMPKGVLEVTL